jgi:CRISPR system Cascade subunit CasC
MSSYLSIHRIVSLNGSIPNRGADGLPKSLVYGGIPRSRVSSQCIKAAIRETFEPEKLGLDKTLRSTVIGEKVIAPGLVAKGLSADEADALAKQIMGLFVSEKEANKGGKENSKKGGKKSSKAKTAAEPAESSDAETLPEDADAEADEPSIKPTTFVVGKKEAEALIEIAYAWHRHGAGVDLRKAVEGKRKSGLPDLDNAVEALRAVKANAGLDGALCGRMSTGVAVDRVDAALEVAHALGVGQVQSTLDFWSAQDQLKDEMGAGHINTREIVAGVFLLEAHLNIDQMRINIKGLTPKQELTLVEQVVRAVVTWQPPALKGSMATHPDEGEVLIVVDDKQPLSLMRAFERPCEHITEVAWNRLLDHAKKVWSRRVAPQFEFKLETAGTTDALVHRAAMAAIGQRDDTALAAE